MPRRDVLEREVKKRITLFLDLLPVHGIPCYYRMPVPVGYGKSGIDYEGCVCGFYFGIEAKSPDEDADLTPRQRETLLDILAGGGAAFVISSDAGLHAFMRWAHRCYKA